MANVVFSSELQKFTGEEQVEISASNYREVLDALDERYARLDKEELLKMAVAIDGVIIAEPLLELVAPNSEIHFLHRISGG